MVVRHEEWEPTSVNTVSKEMTNESLKTLCRNQRERGRPGKRIGGPGRDPEKAHSSMRLAGDDIPRISCCVQPLSIGAGTSCMYASTHLRLGCAARFEDSINWVALRSFRPQRWTGLIGAQVERARVGVE
jgi:hypothetical protein